MYVCGARLSICSFCSFGCTRFDLYFVFVFFLRSVLYCSVMYQQRAVEEVRCRLLFFVLFVLFSRPQEARSTTTVRAKQVLGCMQQIRFNARNYSLRNTKWYIITTIFDVVPHYSCPVFTGFLVSLHGD